MLAAVNGQVGDGEVPTDRPHCGPRGRDFHPHGGSAGGDGLAGNPHRNALPANGNRLRAMTTARRRESSLTQTPGESEFAGTATSTRICVATISTANTMPAIAAALGVRIAFCRAINR